MNSSRMLFHYNEIRYRIFYIFYSLICTLITCYYYQLELMYLISRPFLQLDQILQSTDITEALSTTYKLCIYVSLGVCIFNYIYQYWSFLVPSRYNFERKEITTFLLLFSTIVCIETYLIYFYIFPQICELFSSFQIYINYTDNNQGKINDIYLQNSEKTDLLFYFNKTDSFKIIEMSPRVESTVSSSIQIYFLLVLFFQIPVIFIALFYLSYFDCFSLCRYRKIVFFCIICISSLLSPPEILSQFCCLLVTSFLFEFSLWIGFVLRFFK
ncbi:hypothetical protein ACKKBG_M90040 (mitochondrion) [Auxenochlorella protothecoides x Auxenochlorella symbiontica]